MDTVKIQFYAGMLRYVAWLLVGMVLGGCVVILIGSPTFKENSRLILSLFVAFILFLIALIGALRIYLRQLTLTWSQGRFRELINSAIRYALVAEEREASKDKLAEEVSKGANLLMSVLAVTQATATLFLFLGAFVAVATLITSYMQVERFDVQNSLMAAQNTYFQDQIKELRRQVEIQDEQGDLVRRKDLLETIYDGKERGVSVRVRVEALKSLVRLDNKLISQGAIPESLVNLKGVDFSCEVGSSDCADFSKSWLVRTDFSGSKLKGASFSGADLRDSYFISADLSDADLKFTQLEGAQFRELIPVSLRVDLESGERGPSSVSGLTESVFRELLNIRPPAGSLRTRVQMFREEFALERFPASEALVKSLNILTKSANLENAEFSFIWMGGEFEQLRLRGFKEYKSVDLYTRFPFGAAVSQGKDEVDVYERLDKVQLKADKLFGLYEVNIDVERDFPGVKGNVLACLNSNGWSNRRNVGLDVYDKMPLSEQEQFIIKLCKLDAHRMRGSLPLP